MALICVADCPGCGVGSSSDSFTCTYPCGYLTSPLYPHHYPNNLLVTWNIDVLPGTFIYLTFDTFDVQSESPACLEDSLIIQDVSEVGDIKLLAELCYSRPPSASYLSSWHRLQIKMVADQAYSAAGFMAHYQSKTFELPSHLIPSIKFDGKKYRFQDVGGTFRFLISMCLQSTAFLYIKCIVTSLKHDRSRIPQTVILGLMLHSDHRLCQIIVAYESHSDIKNRTHILEN